MIKINLGCGTTTVEGWHNYDNSPNARLSKFPAVRWLLWKLRILSDHHYRVVWDKDIRVQELTRELPYQSNTVDVVYTSHFLEHLSAVNVDKVLHEIHRVLKPETGILRIVIPDLDFYIQRYVLEKSQKPNEVADEFMTGLNVISNARDPHLWMYNTESLQTKLRKVGFKNVVPASYRKGECPDVELLDNRPVDSLWVEARK